MFSMDRDFFSYALFAFYIFDEEESNLVKVQTRFSVTKKDEFVPLINQSINSEVENSESKEPIGLSAEDLEE